MGPSPTGILQLGLTRKVAKSVELNSKNKRQVIRQNEKPLSWQRPFFRSALSLISTYAAASYLIARIDYHITLRGSATVVSYWNCSTYFIDVSLPLFPEAGYVVHSIHWTSVLARVLYIYVCGGRCANESDRGITAVCVDKIRSYRP